MRRRGFQNGRATDKDPLGDALTSSNTAEAVLSDPSLEMVPPVMFAVACCYKARIFLYS
jgi:hypothetical protein